MRNESFEIKDLSRLGTLRSVLVNMRTGVHAAKTQP